MRGALWIRRGVVAGLTALALGGALVGCADDGAPGGRSPGQGAPPATAEPPAGEAAPGAPVVTKLGQFPILLTSFDASPSGDELLVGDRQGVVRRFERREVDGFVVPQLDPDPILDLSAEVSLLGERGAFDLAFVGDGRWIVVNYTALDGTITLERFPYRAGEPIDRAEGQVVVELPHPYSWHHGGGLAVDEDGAVHMAIGDMEFRQLDPPGPQDPDLVLGGVLRIPADVVEASDPRWEASPDAMVARGMRNPWRISIDRATGDLWLGDVGLDQVEEIDVIAAAELGGEPENFGWPYLEGLRPNQGEVPEGVEVIDPVLERTRDEGACGMVAGHRYRGERLASLRGRFVYADLCDATVRSFAVADDLRASDDREELALPEPIISFGEDRLGELYVLGAAGGLYRLDPGDWSVEGSDQTTDGPVQTTTTVPRTTESCDGIVAAVEPLSRIGGLGPEELRTTVQGANASLRALLPEVAPELAEDAAKVQRTLAALEQQLAAAGWDPGAEALAQIRTDAFSGTGAFTGFPDAMARIVDSECG